MNPTKRSNNEAADQLTLLARIASAIGGVGVRHRRLALAAILLTTVALAPFAASIEQDDDVIRFLPEDDPEVVKFRDIGRRFHGLSIAIVGVEAVDGDLFTVARLRAVRELSSDLATVDGVTATTGFTELADVIETKTKEGAEQSELWDLVGDLPPLEEAETAKSKAQMDEVRQRVMSREHLIGALISEDGDATIVLCQIDPDANVKQTADAIRQRAAQLTESLEGVQLRFGGAPFIGSYAAEHTRRDLLALSPWVVAVVVLIMLLTVRSVSGVIVALGSVGVSIAWVMGGLALAGRTLTLVSSSLPVLLVALGSAYSVHLLAAVLSQIDAGASREEAVSAALEKVGPPIIIAGLTTAAGFVSFVVMDIAPMREFGLLMALATALIVVTTLVLVSSACVVLPLRPRAEGRAPGWALTAMVTGARGIANHRWITAIVSIALVGAAVIGASRVRPHTDIRSLFADDSEPVLAEQFLQERFGGSLFLQIEVAGDIKHPLVLQQVERLAAAARAEDGVAGVQAISEILALAAGATTGEKRVPPSRRTAASLAELVRTDASVRLLVDDTWEHSLIQVRISGFDVELATKVAARLEGVAATLDGLRVSVPRQSLTPEAVRTERQEVSRHLRAVMTSINGRELTDEVLAEVFEPRTVSALRAEVAADLRLNLVDDPIVFLRADADIDAITDATVAAMARGGFDASSLEAVISPWVTAEERENPDGMRDGIAFVFDGIHGLARGRLRQQRVETLLGPSKAQTVSPQKRERIERALWGLADSVAFLPADAVDGANREDEAEVAFTVSGYPLVYAGMNRSVQRNQIGSLVVSGILVFIALALFFRSVTMALVGIVPAALTLLLTFGIMGFSEIPMDVGTSMIAAIALGVGIDYAVHLLWRHGMPSREQADSTLVEALGATGWGIVINALEVSAGLSLLAFGTIVPMRNFGILTATAMLLSAACTLLLVPAMTRWLGASR